MNRRTRWGWLGLLLLAALLGFFGVWPLVSVLGAALSAGPAELLRSELQVALLETLGLAIGVTILAVPLGAALAFVVERTDTFVGGESVGVTTLLTLPLAIPPYLLGMAWALLGNGKSGVLNRLSEAPIIDLYGRDGMILTLTTAAYPLAFLSVQAALQRADPSLEEAARVAGGRPLVVLRTVTLPLLRPALAASAGMIFVFTAAAFGVPYLLGTPADPPVLVLTTRIFREVSLGGELAKSRAAIASLLLLSVAGLVQLGLGLWARRHSVIQVGGKASRPSPFRTGRARGPLRGLVYTFLALGVVLPIGTITYTSFLASFGELDRLTFQQWREVLSREETWRAFGNATLLAVSAGALVAALGFLLARSAQRSQPGRALAAIAELPYAVPGTVLAIGLLLSFSQEVRLILAERITFVLALPGTLGLLWVAYGVKHLALGIRTSQAALRQLHPSLEESARVAGAGPVRAVTDVVLPLARPAVVASFVIVALPCLSELTMSVLLFGAGTETAGTLLFELQSYANPPAASVIATMTVVVAIAGDLGLKAWARRAQGARP
ncbi:MAG: iron ABC transporter permease [Deltaproteobacteria bacterium]|nr:iron ABC transporter permease [Deltaproteobacteria bacterium]